jgi:hypothetical protein
MSNYDPPQQPWGGPPQDPYGGAPQYPPQNPGGYPPPTSAFPPSGGGFPPPTSGGGFPPPTSGAGYPPTSGGGYPPPSDPYGAGGFGQDQYGQQGGFGQPGYGQPGYPPGGYQPPAPSGGGSGKTIAMIIAGVVLLALCGGGIFTAYTLTSDDDEGTPQANNSASAAPSASGTGRPSASSTRSATPTPTSTRGGNDPDTFVKGDCFVNEGTENDPEVKKVACTTAGAYEVVAKITATTDENQCDTRVGKGNWNASYVMDKTPGITGDYVLCLKKR